MQTNFVPQIIHTKYNRNFMALVLWLNKFCAIGPWRDRGLWLIGVTACDADATLPEATVTWPSGWRWGRRKTRPRRSKESGRKEGDWSSCRRRRQRRTMTPFPSRQGQRRRQSWSGCRAGTGALKLIFAIPLVDVSKLFCRKSRFP